TFGAFTISDHWVNEVDIDYSSSLSSSPPAQEIWTVHDGERTATAYFAATGSSDLPAVLDHLDLPPPGGGTSTYSMTHGMYTIPRPVDDNSSSTSLFLPLITSLR